jgi:hypothetical protein
VTAIIRTALVTFSPFRIIKGLKQSLENCHPLPSCELVHLVPSFLSIGYSDNASLPRLLFMSSPLGQFLLLFMTSQLGHPDLVRIGLGQKVQTQQKRPEQQTGFCVQAFSIKLKIALFQAQHFVGLSCDFSQGLCKVQAKDADLTTGDIAARL